MRSIFSSILFSLLLVISFTACGGEDGGSDSAADDTSSYGDSYTMSEYTDFTTEQTWDDYDDGSSIKTGTTGVEFSSIGNLVNVYETSSAGVLDIFNYELTSAGEYIFNYYDAPYGETDIYFSTVFDEGILLIPSTIRVDETITRTYENTFNGELYGGTVKVTLEAHYTAYVVGENSFNDVLEIRWQYIDGESTNDPVMDMTTFMAEGLGQVKIVDNIYGDISLRTDLTSTAVVDDTTNDTADDTTDDTTVSNEGSESSPVSLTLDTTHSAKIGANPFDGGDEYYSYYAFTTSDAGSYIITAASLSESADVDLRVFSDATFDTQEGYSNNSTYDGESLTLTLDGSTTYYLRVENVSEYDLTFNLLVDAPEAVVVDASTSEGSVVSPVSLTLGTAHDGKIGTYSNAETRYSYYEFTTTTAGEYSYAVTYDGDSTSDLDFNLYTTAVNDGYVNTYYNNSAGTFTLDAASTYYLKILNYETADVTFSMTISAPVAASDATFASTTSYAIPDSDMVTGITSTIDVSGASTSISKVTVTLNITHTWDSDIDAYLISPLGTEVVLTTDNGSSGDDFTNTVFDDAATTIIDGIAPFTGSYSPEGLLSTFNSENANGTWSLKVYDDSSGDTGTLDSWSLTIE